MRNPLEKALGVAPRELPPREETLQRLALKGKCAGDPYYASMDPATFNSAMAGCEDEAFFAFYTRQRALGSGAFQAEVAAEIAACTGAELDGIVQLNSHNGGTWLLSQVVAHPGCEFATAMTVYWANQPDAFYTRYGGLEAACQDIESFSHERALLLRAIEQRIHHGPAYVRNLPVPDLSCFLDQRPDYSTPPLDAMPESLRVGA